MLARFPSGQRLLPDQKDLDDVLALGPLKPAAFMIFDTGSGPAQNKKKTTSKGFGESRIQKPSLEVLNGELRGLPVSTKQLEDFLAEQGVTWDTIHINEVHQGQSTHLKVMAFAQDGEALKRFLDSCHEYNRHFSSDISVSDEILGGSLSYPDAFVEFFKNENYYNSIYFVDACVEINNIDDLIEESIIDENKNIITKEDINFIASGGIAVCPSPERLQGDYENYMANMAYSGQQMRA